jgi:hypothetical protein
MLSSRSPTLDDAADLLFREQCRRQLQRTVETRMKYGFCRVSRPGLDKPTSRVFPSTRAYREWCVANLPAYLGYQPAPPGMNNHSPFNPLQATSEGIFPVASNRIKDRADLYLRNHFRIEYESRR